MNLQTLLPAVAAIGRLSALIDSIPLTAMQRGQANADFAAIHAAVIPQAAPPANPAGEAGQPGPTST